MSPRKTPLSFPTDLGGPPPLSATTTRQVRFEEVDPLNIVWHGRYPSYLEDARAAFGEKFDLTYLDMFREQFIAPIVEMHIDYFKPLAFGDTFSITARLHWSEAARLNFEYRIENAQGERVATGYTVQFLMDLDRQMLLVWPEYLENLLRRWKAGEIS